MADGRKIPYLIELAADDKKIRQQMAKINWEELLGSKGKGFGDVLVSDVKEAKDQIKRTLGGLDIDWSKILGAKEIGQLEQAVTKALSKSRKEIELFAASGDTTGLEKTIKYVSALGEELKGLGSDFDAASLARGMSAFMKVLTPLTAKFDALADEPKKVEAAFDKLFSGISTSAKSVDLGKAFDVSGKIKIAMQGLKATNDEILEATESLEKYRNVVAKLSGDNPATIKLAQDVAGLNQQLDEQMRKEEQLASQNKTNSAQYAATLKNIMAIENARLKLKEKPTKDYAGMEIREDFGYYEEQINKVVERISKKMTEVEAKLANTVDKSFAEIISKQISDIKLSVSLSEQAQAEFVNKINDFVQNVNKSPIEKVQIGVKPLLDDSANLIEDKQKRGYGQNEADDDVNTTKLIAQTEKRFKGIRGAMYRNQNKILQQTKEWRQQMLEQFKFKSGDFEFNFNNNLVEELQSLFDEYGLKINIDPTYLADQIKTVLEGSNVSLGGGTASVDQESMMKAVMVGVRAAFFGESLPTTTVTTPSQERIPDATEQVASEIEQTAKHLDIAEEYVRDVVAKIKAVAKYAVKPSDKDTTGTKATREQFRLWGVDLEKVLGATDDSQIATMLEQSLLKRGDFNKLIGSTVIDELSTFKGSSSNTIYAFVNSLREMFYMLQEDTETVDEWNRKKHSREIFDYARGQARAASSLRDVRSPIRTGKIPDIEYIDKAIAAMSAIGKNTDSLTALKLAREKLGGKTDEQSVQEFNAIANEFYKNTTKVFYDIKKQAEDSFKGTVYLQGSKKGIVKKQNIENYKQLARVGDDDVILDIRVTSSLNNVSLGTTKSKYKDRISPYEEKRLLDGKRGDYIVSPEYEKDILNRELEYGGFKPQGAPTTDVNLDATLEANIKKREVLMAEIKANEEEKKLLREQIEAADKQIAVLTAKNNEIPQGRRDAALRKIVDQEAKKSTLTNDIFWLEEQVGNGKEGDEQKVGSLTKQIEEQLDKRAIAERHLAELSELDVERRKKSLTNKVAEIEQDDLPKLQEELTKVQTKYSIANSEKILAQVEVNKANSSLKAIPKNKANAEARAEAEARVNKANSELARTTESFEEASRDVDSITTQIENSKRKIENLQSQISETTLEAIRQEQTARIEAINNAITSLENEFASKLAEKKVKETSLKRTNTTLDRARNDSALRTQRELDEAIARREGLIARDGELDKSSQNKQEETSRLGLLNQRVEAEKEYNTLQEKSMVLQGSIKKMEEDGATEDALSNKRAELEKINTELAESLKKVQSLGGFIGQRETREYTDAERKAYALEEIKKIDNDLITARAQKNVVAARISKKDREIAEVDRWGLGAGIGARTLNQEKYKLTSEFMDSDYMKLFDSMFSMKKELEEAQLAYQTAMSRYYSATDKQWDESLPKSERDEWETVSLKALDDADKAKYLSNQISEAIINTSGDENFFRKLMNLTDDQNDQLAIHMPTEDINNPRKVREFLLNDRTGQWIASQYESKEKALWDEYYESLQQKRQSIIKEFKDSIVVDDGVLKGTFKFKDALGERDELVEVYVRDALRKRLVDAKEILEEEQTPIQSNIDRLYADRKTAIEYGGVGDKEILSADVIEDQIRKEERLAQLQEQRTASIQKLSDLEQAGVEDSDESVKQEKKKRTEIEKQIAQLEMLIRNRQKLVELRWDESKAGSYTDEEKELHFTEQVVGYNQKIEDSLVRQEDLKQKIANASEEEKTKLQYQLAKEEENVAKWRKSISTAEGKLQKIETTKSVVSTSEASNDSIVSLMKEALGSADVDLTPVTEILNKILEILNTFKTEGIKKGGTKDTSEEKQKQTKKTEADLIRDNALKQHDVVRGLAAGRGSLYNQYTKDVEELNKAVEEANAASEKDKKKAIAKVKTKAQKVSALSYNILKNTSQWDYLVSQSDSGAKNLHLKQGESLKDKMETTAKKEHGILGKRGGQLKNPKYKYDFLGFDGDTLTYQLTDIEGKTRKVTMVWNEFTKQVAITSDKTGSKLSELAGKIESFGEKFKDAIDSGYLGAEDKDLKRFQDAIAKINTEIANGASFADVDKLRNEALRIADEVTKKVNKSKRAYSGTTEINAATKQHDNLEFSGFLDQEDMGAVKAYNKAYAELLAKHNEFKMAGTLYDPNNQKLIQQMAIQVKALGKELDIAQSEMQDLQQKVLNSGTYNGRAIGDISQVQQDVDVYAQMRAKLEELGATNIKVDRIHQKATGTIRVNNRVVHDLEVAYHELSGSMARYHKQERESLTGVPAFLNGFQKKFNSIMQYLTMTMSIHQVMAQLRKGVQYVRDIDLALTELKKVTDETEETYDEFLETASKTAAKVGSTIKDVVSSTADWARLGYSIKEAAELAESTQILMNVSEFTDVSQATDTLISSVQAFGYTAETSMEVVDLLNTIGNNYAISTADLAQSLTKSSASLVAAGGDLAEAAALTATANKIIQDADSVGTALKTTSLRLRGTDVEILEEEGLDSEGAVTSKSKLQSKVKALSGVDILTETGEYKSTYKILSDIADVWESISDMDQAALLELISGKRNSSVIAAILQNPEELKAAYEDAMNAEGSALKENEKYLDSIQGKIDQFQNATQTMWSNFLDDDVVKFVVELGTKLIKLVDKIGVIPSALAAVLVYLTAFKKQNPIDWIQDIVQYLGAFNGPDGFNFKQLIGQLLGIVPAMKMVTAETVANTVATQAQDAALSQDLMTKMGLANVTGNLSMAQKEQAASAIFAAFTSGQLSQVQASAMLATLGYKMSLDGANWSLKALDTTTKAFMATNPIGWILAIISVVVVLATLLSKIPSDLERLEEKMSDLNSEISDLESEIDSLNSELETTQERIAELLAMDSLSFVEQEELKNLQLQNAELERQVELQEVLLKAKEKERAEAAKEWVDNVWNGKGVDKKYFVSGNGTISEDKWLTAGISGKEALETSLPKYAELQKNMEGWEDVYLAAQKELNDSGKLSYETFKGVVNALPDIGDNPEAYYDQKFRYSDEKLVELFKKRVVDQNNNTIDNMTSGIEMVLGDMSKVISDNELSYSMGDENVNKFLDEYFAYQYAYQEAQGISAKSSAIASIFDDTSSDSIKKLKEDLSEIAGDDTLDAAKKQENALGLVNKAINSTSGEYDRLKTSMDIVGITADEVARYFTQMSLAPDSSTVEGLTAQYQKGVEALSKYQGAASDVIAQFTDLDGSVEQITWGSLFDDDGKIIDTQISKVLQGANETTRAEFARIAKSVNEGTMSIEQAMSSFSGSGLVSVSKLIEESFGELNKSVFKGLEDEISGFIDTFSEFSSALENVASSMDLLYTAQEQYNNSGQVSVKTALELMQSTDQWNEILTVENGKIRLNADAQDILVQSKLNTVKANLAEAKASIQNQLAQLGAADATLLSAEASDITTEAYTIYTNAMNSYTASIAGFGAALDALVNGRIFGNDGIIGSFQSAYEATKQVTTYENNTNIAALRERLAEVDQMEDFFKGVDTFDEFANNYDFDETPGDKYGNDEDSKTEEKMDAFQREMDYWENRIGANQARYEQVQNEIDLLETKGQKAGTEYYREQLKIENQRKWLLAKQRVAALEHLAVLEEGSEQWWEVANTLNDIEGELDDVTASIVDLQDAIGEIDTYKFEEFNTRLDNLASKLSTIRDLIAPNGEEDWFDEEGNWTDAGIAVAGTYLQELETYKQGYQETMDEFAKYESPYAGNEEYYASLGIHSEQEYYDKTEELISQQYDFAESISDTEQSIVDMYESSIDAVEEYVDTLIDGYNDYIDSVKEALDAERDLYDFKKNVQKQAKDIAEIERRIASLSGSTNKSDIAERRKLEAQLYESRESLNDTYYDHAKDSQNDALDAEATAYEETMVKMIEGMRTSLQEATADMDTFLNNVTIAVSMNADTVLEKYKETNVYLDPALTNPWENAKTKVGEYGDKATNLMDVWKKDGYFAEFSTTAGTNLSSPWSSGTSAANAFKSSVDTAMDNVVDKISSNVQEASGQLSNLYQQIKDTEARAVTAANNMAAANAASTSSTSYAPTATPPSKSMHHVYSTVKDIVIGSQSYLDQNTKTIDGVKYYLQSSTGYYYKIGDLKKKKYDGGRSSGWVIPAYTSGYSYYAKGTTGSPRDEWAITDEPQFGDELVLVPGKDGNLSFMRKGTGVVPADLTANLMEWGQFTPDSMNLGGGVNINMINNAVNRPEFNLNVDNFLRCDNVSQDSLPELKHFVKEQMDSLVKQMNYSLKRFSR